MTPDPFGVARLRVATLATWAAQPARFREDANAEEDHGRGWYRDRVVVELAQNAADAAVRAGVPGRLLLRLVRDGDSAWLVAANTGAPLDAAGVASLASLRASAKRPAVDAAATADAGAGADAGSAARDVVGRFGVGFAAVRAVSDEIAVVSATGTVHFSLARTGALLTDVPDALAGEVARRQGSLPVLRLPFEGPPASGPAAASGTGPAGALAASVRGTGPDDVGPVADGWATAVVLRLRDRAAVDVVRTQLAAVGDPLLLALPGLSAVTVEVDGSARVLADVGARWVVAQRGGVVPPELLADRPVEERDRTGWQVTWAVPRPGALSADPSGEGTAAPAAGTTRRVLHAPTPTDDPCTVPALLVATFPLDPSRRRVAAGPLTDHLVARAGEVWADLLVACRDAEPGTAPNPLELLPTGMAAGPVDAALREAVLEASRSVPLLVPADGRGAPLPAGQAMVLDGPAGTDAAVMAALGPWFPHLVTVDPQHRGALRALGVAHTELADLVDALPALGLSALRRLCDAFLGADRSTLEGLATLAVPLADGRSVRGARGLVLPDASLDPAVLRVLVRWGVRVVHPDVAHPLLERLGALPADAAALLRHPVLRARVLDDRDHRDDHDDDRDRDDHDDQDDDQDDDDRLDPDHGEDTDDHAPRDADVDADADQHGALAAVVADAPEVEPTAAVMLVLAAAAAAEGDPQPQPWWGEVLLPAQDGDVVPARGLVMPGSSASGWFDPEVLPPVAESLVAHWAPALMLLGVRTGLTVLHLPVTPTGEPVEEDVEPLLASLPGWEDYLERIGTLAGDPGGADAVDLLAVGDLDAVLREAWPQVLRGMTRGEPREALLQPVRTAAGTAPSYTAWWLRRRAWLGLDRPFALRGSWRWVTVLGEPPEFVRALDPVVQRALGGVGDAGDLGATGWAELLDALPPEGEPVDAALAVAVWRGLARLAVADPSAALEPDRLPGLVESARIAMVPADDVAVATPRWSQHPGVGPVVVVPAGVAADLAEVLDVDTAEERAPGTVTSSGRAADVPGLVRAVYGDAPAGWVEHEDLLVDGHPVDWWVQPGLEGPVVHAATTTGLARGLAEVVGWAHRDRIERLLTEPPSLLDALLDRAGDPPQE